MGRLKFIIVLFATLFWQCSANKNEFNLYIKGIQEFYAKEVPHEFAKYFTIHGNYNLKSFQEFLKNRNKNIANDAFYYEINQDTLGLVGVSNIWFFSAPFRISKDSQTLVNELPSLENYRKKWFVLEEGVPYIYTGVFTIKENDLIQLQEDSLLNSIRIDKFNFQNMHFKLNKKDIKVFFNSTHHKKQNNIIKYLQKKYSKNIRRGDQIIMCTIP